MKVLVFDTIELLYEKLLEEFLTEIKNNPEINLGLATGSTTELLYKGLILDHLENKTSYVIELTISTNNKLITTIKQDFYCFYEQSRLPAVMKLDNDPKNGCVNITTYVRQI